MTMDDVNTTNNFSIQPDMSVNSSLHAPVCININFFIMLGFFFIDILFCLPFFILVLFVGFQRWRKQRSVTTSATTSHCDFFTYNVVALELISIVGCFIFISRNYEIKSKPILFEVGTSIFSIVSNGQTVFHVLTCVERYLAVVHPITYIGLRQASAVRIRNISTGCIWLLLIASRGLKKVPLNNFNNILSMVFMVICTIVIVFCSLSVLCVLIRSAPGDVNVNRERVDQSKLRAFHTIVAIMGALLLRFMTTVISHMIHLWSVPTNTHYCERLAWSYWFTLPSALVLPLLFLQRAGKLPGCKHNNE